MNNWLALLLGGGVGSGFIWGIVEVIKTIANHPLRQVSAADQLSDSALELIKQANANAQAARDEATQARREADDARREAAEARREATDARREAMSAVAGMRRLTGAILSPYATLEGLRSMVSDPPTGNGTAAAVRS